MKKLEEMKTVEEIKKHIEEVIDARFNVIDPAKEREIWEQMHKKYEATKLQAMRIKLCFDRGMTVEEAAEYLGEDEDKIEFMYWFMKENMLDWTGCDFTTVTI